MAGFLSATVFTPFAASASIFPLLGTRTAEANTQSAAVDGTVMNSQKMPLVAASNIGPGMLSGDPTSADSVVIDSGALSPVMGPGGNASDAADLGASLSGGITFYTVRDGDTIASVADMFGVTSGTIRSANSLKAGQSLKPGTTLTILPVSGLTYTIKKGDTVKSIAKAYGVDASDINFYNDIAATDTLNAGDTIIIPDGNFDGTSDSSSTSTQTNTKKPPVKTPTPSTNNGKVPMTSDGLYTTTKNGTNSTPIVVHPLKAYSKIDLGNALLRPIALGAGYLSQRLHGWDKTAVDIAAPLGTPIRAAADGTILLARTGGYNGGYGNYVILLSVIDGNTVETIYGHMSKVLVSVGQTVSRGQTIGLVGKTGDATGYHLHVEVRGAKNPFVDPNYSGN